MTITDEMKAQLDRLLRQLRYQKKKQQQVIKDMYEKTGYVIDTHTAVAASTYKKYVAETNDDSGNSYCFNSKSI